jgi:hypothetical protein
LRAVLGITSDKHAFLDFIGSDGVECISLGVDRGGEGELRFIDSQHNERIVLSLGDDRKSPTLQLWGDREKGDGSIVLDVDHGGDTSIELLGSRGAKRIELLVVPSDFARISLHKDMALPRAEISTEKNGTPKFLMRNSDGSINFEAP